MTTKLTLTVDKDTIERAKKYAKEQGRSLSSIVENYLKLLSSKERNREEFGDTSVVKSLLGSLKLPENISEDYKKEIREAKGERAKRKWGY
ncbi:DUF6364 family protein [Ekhidna sp.]|uniref:DUF6364 family protein n=1 Tax=Ekhidna sp. TaxID=2608089 RepID=UPI0032F00816